MGRVLKRLPTRLSAPSSISIPATLHRDPSQRRTGCHGLGPPRSWARPPPASRQETSHDDVEDRSCIQSGQVVHPNSSHAAIKSAFASPIPTRPDLATQSIRLARGTGLISSPKVGAADPA